MLKLARSHPFLVAFIAACVVAGVLLAFRIAPDAWPAWRKLAAGVLGGSFAGYFITLSRLLGAFSGSEDRL